MMNTRWISLGLSLIGVGGTALTSWLAVRCYKKAEEMKDDIPPDETRMEKVVRVGKTYAPAIISGAGTSACILGSHHLSRKEIAGLTAGLAYMTANRDKIEKKMRGLVGDEKVKQIKAQAAAELSEEKKKEGGKTIIENTGHGNIHFIEEMFGREFYCSIEHVDWACKMINHMFMQGERINYNTFYELLGLKKTRAGWENGWPANEDIYGYSIDTPICFDRTPVTDENGEVVWILSCRMTPPINGYLEMEE